MHFPAGGTRFIVHCCTGSLEIVDTDVVLRALVHCCTGSLEINRKPAKQFQGVHCCTGSLEIFITLAFGIGQLTNASKGLSTRSVSSPNEPRWLWLLYLSLVLMRCQPLRRALYYLV